ncbi:hypothetical protein FHX69_7368 [Prauserella muralis]|nr:hypothetical protein FHX69_7368 [Prauserella muralis]
MLRPAAESIDPPPPHARLPVHARPPAPAAPHAQARWWWVSCHGGSGASTLARLIPGGWESGPAWPNPQLGGPPGVLLVCRSHHAGLSAASAAVRQWASGHVPRTLALWGLVIVADAPGRLPRSLLALRQRISGTVRATFFVPWVEVWRTEEPSRDTAPRQLAQLGELLQSTPWITKGQQG